MPENKKHHYVPRFYLEFFSNVLSKKHIGLYNFETSKFVSSAALKSQSYEDYFYGKDGKIEKALSKIENETSKVLKRIIKEQNLPKPRADYTSIWLFTFLQINRTKFKAKETNELLDKTLKEIFKDIPEMKDLPEGHGFEITDPVALNLETLFTSLNYVTDLACKLIVNKSEIRFITSDNPVIRYNQFLERKNKPGGKNGFASKGLQVFIPISPYLALIFYDSIVYQVGKRMKSRVITTEQADVDALNLLQTLNCESQIYFNNFITEEYINQLSEKRKSFLPQEKSMVKEYKGEPKADGSSSSIIHSTYYNPETDLKLSFISETEHARTYVLSDYAVEVRHESMRLPIKI